MPSSELGLPLDGKMVLVGAGEKRERKWGGKTQGKSRNTRSQLLSTGKLRFHFRAVSNLHDVMSVNTHPCILTAVPEAGEKQRTEKSHQGR